MTFWAVLCQHFKNLILELSAANHKYLNYFLMYFHYCVFGCKHLYWILWILESKLEYFWKMLRQILRNPWFKPILLPFCIESFICRNISDSSSLSVLKLITKVKSLIFKFFKITKIVPVSVPSTDNESYTVIYNFLGAEEN